MSLLEPPRAKAAPTTLAADVFRRLREDLLAGLFPAGEKLRLNDLKDRYEVGFSPLREALMHLVSDGLVVMEQQKGFRAAPVSLEDLWDVTRTRQFIEPQLLRDAVATADDAWESNIVATFHRLEKVPSMDPATGAMSQEWARRHHAFHHALIASASSRWLKKFWQIAYDQSDRYRRISTSVVGGREAEHRQIMEAALARDADRLVAINDQHIRTTAEVVAGHLTQYPAGLAR